METHHHANVNQHLAWHNDAVACDILNHIFDSILNPAFKNFLNKSIKDDAVALALI